MSNSLSDQLLKLGLVDEKSVKKAQHTKRQSHKKLGRRGLESEKSARQERAAEALEQQRAADRKRGVERAQTHQTKEVKNQIEQLIGSGRLTGRVSGRRRFYVVMPDGRIPYLDVSDQVLGDLERGRAALAYGSNQDAVLINGDAAEKIEAVDAARILVWNQAK